MVAKVTLIRNRCYEEFVQASNAGAWVLGRSQLKRLTIQAAADFWNGDQPVHNDSNS